VGNGTSVYYHNITAVGFERGPYPSPLHVHIIFCLLPFSTATMHKNTLFLRYIFLPPLLFQKISSMSFLLCYLAGDGSTVYSIFGFSIVVNGASILTYLLAATGLGVLSASFFLFGVFATVFHNFLLLWMLTMPGS
jgi:hypothetical protein